MSTTTMAHVPRGKSKSGRFWRAPGQKSFNAISVRPLKKPWSKRQVERSEKKIVLQFERELKEAAKREKDEKRKRIEEHRKRREANIKKSEVVQKITNIKKLKKLKKKQLKAIRKQ